MAETSERSLHPPFFLNTPHTHKKKKETQRERAQRAEKRGREELLPRCRAAVSLPSCRTLFALLLLIGGREEQSAHRGRKAVHHCQTSVASDSPPLKRGSDAIKERRRKETRAPSELVSPSRRRCLRLNHHQIRRCRSFRLRLCRRRSLPSREVIRHRILAALSHQHRCCYSKIPFLFLRVCYLSPLKLRWFCSCRYLNLCRRGYCCWSRWEPMLELPLMILMLLRRFGAAVLLPEEGNSSEKCY
ncbi:uncharacterized protein LOC110266850 [Arachis ipaensis]|uniref:uncharacterized protein LOC110266850 n=1 Tax=Arachis ipaensis TaxID=130454 RepID=UPI000A2B83CA|nr:uncharacterized protein LOC110266850 [Arachis ipaensis]